MLTYKRLTQLQKAASGDIVFVASPATKTRAATTAAFTRTVDISLQSADGEIHEWFNKAITSGVSVSKSSTAGAATIPSTTLTFVNGVASVVLSGTAAAWLADDTNTVTVAQASIMGTTVASVTSVETIVA
jgi:hypothetical protein